MSVECWVIIVLILAMAVIIMRRGTPRQGVSILPLALVPFGYLIAGPISRWLDGFFPSISSDLFRVSFTLIALVFACVLFGMLAGNMGGKATSAKLILAGMAVSAVCSAFSNFVIYITNDKNAATEVMKWSMGSLAGASWTRVGVMLPVTLVCVAVFWTQYRNLNLMLLGDDVSITLGTDLHRLRTFYLIVASVMIGFAVYCAGVIGFVGLVIPHVVRILFGTDHRKLLPLSALLGASFLIWCDVACRVILKNSEMPIGVLVSIIGAPCFIYLLVRKSYGFGGAR